MRRAPAYGYGYPRRWSPVNLLIAAALIAGIGWATHWHPFTAIGGASGAQAQAVAQGAAPAQAHLTAAGRERAALAGAPKAITFALAQVGRPYVWAGDGRPSDCRAGRCGGWDCSGLVTAAWAQAGRAIPRSTQTEWSGLARAAKLMPGVLILYDAPPAYPGEKQPGHVALYIGHGLMVEAYDIDVGVRKTPLRHGWRGLALPLAA